MGNGLIRILAGLVIVSGTSSCEKETPTATSPTPWDPGVPAFTPGAGLTATPAIRGSIGDFKFKTIHEGFHFEFNSHGAADIVTTSVTGATGAHSGWHYHPGPAIVIVRRGTLTSYVVEQGQCVRTEYPAGTALVEGTSPHIVVNEGSADIELSVVFFTPAGVAQRIDTADPGIC